VGRRTVAEKDAGDFASVSSIRSSPILGKFMALIKASWRKSRTFSWRTAWSMCASSSPWPSPMKLGRGEASGVWTRNN